MKIGKISSYYIKRNATGFIWKIFRFILLIGICYIFLFPVIYMLSVSVRSAATVNDPSIVWIPRELSLESVKTAFDILEYPRAVTTTLIMTLGSTLASLISCSLAGYGFARFRFKEKNFAFAMVILTIIVPPQTVIISNFINFRNFDFFGITRLLHLIIPAVPDTVNLINTPFTFILPALFGAGLRAGLFIFIFRQFFAGMPKDLEEAAMIDGCGAFRTYLQVMLPLAKSAFITVLLFSFIWHWNDYFSASMYFNDNQPIAVMLNQMKSLLQDAKLFNFVTNTPDEIRTYLQAGCLLTIIVPLILYIFTQRFFTESIERTGIVG
ncbi:MAG: carbohydrate ABC transporter permease [Clostridia bacterium]|nr:carbohydrate ABC transporter permease [Clostridia bacterium]